MTKTADSTDTQRKAPIDQADNVIRLVNAGQGSLKVFMRLVDERMESKQRELEEFEIATDLVNRIGVGDPAAETELVQRYEERLRYVMLRQMAHYPHDVDDVVQSALSTAILRLREQGIADPARLGGFIYGIAKNLRRATLRDHGRHEGNEDPDLITRLPDDQPGPEHVAAGQETTRIVRQLLAELGQSVGRERDREVLIRLYVYQQSRDEICEDLDIPKDHLRRVVHRAKRRLKVLLLESEQLEALGLKTDD